jgi:hypothetical protein
MVSSYQPEERWHSELNGDIEIGKIAGIYYNNFISLQASDEADEFGK